MSFSPFLHDWVCFSSVRVAPPLCTQIRTPADFSADGEPEAKTTPKASADSTPSTIKRGNCF
jgi:hypothetical protein